MTPFAAVFGLLKFVYKRVFCPPVTARLDFQSPGDKKILRKILLKGAVTPLPQYVLMFGCALLHFTNVMHNVYVQGVSASYVIREVK